MAKPDGIVREEPPRVTSIADWISPALIKDPIIVEGETRFPLVGDYFFIEICKAALGQMVWIVLEGHSRAGIGQYYTSSGVTVYSTSQQTCLVPSEDQRLDVVTMLEDRNTARGSLRRR